MVWTYLPAGEVINTSAQVAGAPLSANGLTFTTPTITGLSFVTQSHIWNQPGSTNCFTIMSNGGFVTLQATLSTTDNNAASLINWSCGQPVPGQPFQRQLSTSNPTNYIITASVGSTQRSFNVWVIWATNTLLTTGTLPRNAPAFPATINGIQFLDGTTNILGPLYWADHDAAAVKTCAVATLLPPGVGALIPSGFAPVRFRWTHTFENGVPVTDTNHWTTNWVPDLPQNSSIGNQYTTKADSNGNLYSIDGPNMQPIVGHWGVTNSTDKYSNFRDYLTFLGVPCSNTNFWYYAAQWTNSGPTYQVHNNFVNTTNIILPTNSAYKP
jgi:hypothetical protein